MRVVMSSFNGFLQKVDAILQVERSYKSGLGAALPSLSTCVYVCRDRAMSDRTCVRLKSVEEGENSRKRRVHSSKIRSPRRERQLRRSDRTAIARTPLSPPIANFREMYSPLPRVLALFYNFESYTFSIGHRTAPADLSAREDPPPGYAACVILCLFLVQMKRRVQITESHSTSSWKVRSCRSFRFFECGDLNLVLTVLYVPSSSAASI